VKKFFVLLAVLSLVLFSAGSAAGSAHAAASQIDNLPGGASVAQFQVGAGWETLINIQHTGDPKIGPADACALVHLAIYDVNSVHVLDFNLSLTNTDNVGLVIRPGAAAGQIQLFDYSDGAFGGSAALNDIATGPGVAATIPADANGISVGYVTVVRTDDFFNVTGGGGACTGGGGAPAGNITGVQFFVPDSLIVRTAMLTSASAIAFNAPMLQGFINLAHPITEPIGGGFVTTVGGAPAITACTANGDVDTLDTAAAASLDDGNGANLDFAELLVTNFFSGAGGVVCDGGVGATGIFNAMGSANALWWARFNVDPEVPTMTTLTLVSPNFADRGGFGRSNNISALSYDDAETPISFGPVPAAEVEFRPFGSVAGAINPGAATAGESLLTYNTPAFGFTFTESTAFADIYPLVRDRIAVNICDATLSGVIAGTVASCVAVGP
jgi:hypothetical protein